MPDVCLAGFQQEEIHCGKGHASLVVAGTKLGGVEAYARRENRNPPDKHETVSSFSNCLVMAKALLRISHSDIPNLKNLTVSFSAKKISWLKL